MLCIVLLLRDWIQVLFSILLGLFSVVKGTGRSMWLVTRTLVDMLKASKHRLAAALVIFLSFNLCALGCVLWTVPRNG